MPLPSPALGSESKLMAEQGRPQAQQELALIRALQKGGATGPTGVDPKDADAAYLQAWAREVKQQASVNASELAKARRQRQSDALREMATSAPNGVHRWLKGEPCPPIMGVEKSPGQWTTCPEEVLALVLHEWAGLWQPVQSAAEPEAYIGKWWPSCAPVWDLPPISGLALQEACKATAPHSAAGLDGWSVEALRHLPLPEWDALACILRAIEEGAPWPSGLNQTLVTLLPKGLGSGPLDQRPIVLLPLVYRLWAKVRGKTVRDCLRATLWACGTAPPPMYARQALRNQTMAALYGTRRGIRSCAVALNLHVPGSSLDPVVIVPAAVILTYARRLRRGIFPSEMLEEMWPKGHDPAWQTKCKHRCPLAMVAKEAERIGWVAPQPWSWISPTGEPVDLASVHTRGLPEQVVARQPAKLGAPATHG